jgi:hypothetical protein
VGYGYEIGWSRSDENKVGEMMIEKSMIGKGDEWVSIVE